MVPAVGHPLDWSRNCCCGDPDRVSRPSCSGARPRLLEMVVGLMPEIARAKGEPLAKTDKIILFGEGAATGLTRDMTGSMLQTFEAMKASVGLDIPKLIRDVSTGGLVGRRNRKHPPRRLFHRKQAPLGASSNRKRREGRVIRPSLLIFVTLQPCKALRRSGTGCGRSAPSRLQGRFRRARSALPARGR